MPLHTYATREEWLAARKPLITASDVPAILGISKYRTAMQVYSEKKGLLPERDSNIYMRMGQHMEGFILDEYTLATERTVARMPLSIYVSDSIPWFGASLDAMWAGGPVECKMTADRTVEDEQSEHRLEFEVQLYAQMIAANTATGSLAALLTGWGEPKIWWRDYARNEKLEAGILAKLHEFKDRLDRGDMPTANGRDLGALKEMWPEDDGTTTMLPEEHLSAVAMLEKAKAAKAIAEADEKDAKARIIQAMGSSSKATLPDGGYFSYKQVNRKGYTVEPSTHRELRKHK